MGQCGCGDFNSEKAFRVGNSIVSYQIYRGCEYCFQGIGLDMSFFSLKNDWVKPSEADRVIPDRDGSNDGRGYAVPILEVQDLREAAKALLPECGDIDPEGEGYRTLDEWLEDYGLRVLQDAIRLNTKRLRGGDRD